VQTSARAVPMTLETADDLEQELRLVVSNTAPSSPARRIALRLHGAVTDPDAIDVHAKDPARPREARPLVVENAAAFLAQAQDKPQWVIPELVAVGGISMFHGRPRSMKSLTALALAVDASLGGAVFGAERFRVARPIRCAYMTEEDSAGLVASRLRWLLAGAAASPPEHLWLSARKGLSLETVDSQAQIVDVIHALSPELLIFDTGRAFAPSVDAGPKDSAGPIRFLRSILAETCIQGLVLVHHDTKPARDGKDERARAERASGGGLLAATDCPIGFERIDDRSAIVVPDRFKPSADPAPFRITFQSATPSGLSFRDWVRARATESTEQRESEDRAAKAVGEVLDQADEWLSGNAVVDRAGGRRVDVLAALRRLVEGGQAATRQGKRGKEYRRALS